MYNPSGITRLKILLLQERDQKLQHSLQYMAKYTAVGLQMHTICRITWTSKHFPYSSRSFFNPTSHKTIPYFSSLEIQREDEKTQENFFKNQNDGGE